MGGLPLSDAAIELYLLLNISEIEILRFNYKIFGIRFQVLLLSLRNLRHKTKWVR
jgi:hypothetical protein